MLFEVFFVGLTEGKKLLSTLDESTQASLGLLC